jgi:hypothetical protein
VIHKHVVNLLHVSAFFGHLLTTDFSRRLPTEDGRKWPKPVGGLPQVYISLCLITVQLLLLLLLLCVCVCIYIYIYIYIYTVKSEV